MVMGPPTFGGLGTHMDNRVTAATPGEGQRVSPAGQRNAVVRRHHRRLGARRIESTLPPSLGQRFADYCEENGLKARKALVLLVADQLGVNRDDVERELAQLKPA
jgi:hypothetical protein